MRSNRGSLGLGCVLVMVALVLAAVAAVLLVTWMGRSPEEQPLTAIVDDYYARVNDGDYPGALELICRDQRQSEVAQQTGQDVQDVIRWGRPLRYQIDDVQSLAFPGAIYTTISVSLSLPSGQIRSVLITIAEAGGDPCIQKMAAGP